MEQKGIIYALECPIDTVTFANFLDLETVPVLWRGIYDKDFIENFKINTEIQEGVVIRIAESFPFDKFNESVAKWVRTGHVTTEDHWMFKKIVPNELKPI